jgi:transmembrane sensor
MKTIPEQIVHLILAKRKRELTINEDYQLQDWLDSSSVNRDAANELSKLFEEFLRASQYQDIDIEDAWLKIKNRTSTDIELKRKVKFMSWKAIAAVLLPLFIIGSLAYYFQATSKTLANIKPGTSKAILELATGDCIELSSNNIGSITDDKGVVIGHNNSNTLVFLSSRIQTNENNTLLVPIGGEYKLVLSDGTQIAVNSGSKIRFPNVFAGNERIVELEGEAYFEVAKNVDKPFIVKTLYSEVKVTGTKFNVCSYRSDQFEHVTLEEGSVQVTTNGDVYSLLPGKQYALNCKTNATYVNDVETYLYTSWKDGMFRFQDLALESLTTKLHRWYNVEFKFKDQSCRSLRFTGAIDRRSNLGEFVKVIESTTNVRFELDNRTIVVGKK